SIQMALADIQKSPYKWLMLMFKVYIQMAHADIQKSPYKWLMLMFKSLHTNGSC
ncbi:hypothetical protein BgiBS90_006003, partial [Biomphalaria glabrata]